jgi:hypothetical protein
MGGKRGARIRAAKGIAACNGHLPICPACQYKNCNKYKFRKNVFHTPKILHPKTNHQLIN